MCSVFNRCLYFVDSSGTTFDGIVKSRSVGTMMTSNEVISSAEVNEPGARLFFRPFLIVHLATNADMDDYLGFTSPNPTRFYEFTLNPK